MVATKRMLNRARFDDAKRQRTSYSLARAVRSLAESKYYNSNIVHASTTSSTTVISAVPAGDTSSSRDGRKIIMTSLSVQLRDDTAGGSGVPHRVVIYVPKNASAALTLASLNSGVDNDEFWVLSDRLYDTSYQNAINIQMNRKLTMEFSGPSGNDFVRNPVKMLILTDGNRTCFGHTKMWYKDI